MKYQQYKGMYWKFLEPSKDCKYPVWKVSEFEDDSYCCVWLFNATIYSLDQAYKKVEEDEGYQMYKSVFKDRTEQILYHVCINQLSKLEYPYERTK